MLSAISVSACPAFRIELGDERVGITVPGRPGGHRAQIRPPDTSQACSGCADCSAPATGGPGHAPSGCAEMTGPDRRSPTGSSTLAQSPSAFVPLGRSAAGRQPRAARKADRNAGRSPLRRWPAARRRVTIEGACFTCFWSKQTLRYPRPKVVWLKGTNTSRSRGGIPTWTVATMNGRWQCRCRRLPVPRSCARRGRPRRGRPFPDIAIVEHAGLLRALTRPRADAMSGYGLVWLARPVSAPAHGLA
jgi:hypothetical protein